MEAIHYPKCVTVSNDACPNRHLEVYLTWPVLLCTHVSLVVCLRTVTCNWETPWTLVWRPIPLHWWTLFSFFFPHLTPAFQEFNLALTCLIFYLATTSTPQLFGIPTLVPTQQIYNSSNPTLFNNNKGPTQVPTQQNPTDRSLVNLDTWACQQYRHCWARKKFKPFQ